MLLLCASSLAAQAAEPGSIASRLRVVAAYDKPLAHEGPLYLAERRSLFFTSIACNDRMVVSMWWSHFLISILEKRRTLG